MTRMTQEEWRIGLRTKLGRHGLRGYSREEKKEERVGAP
jgi:hypothetical protein